MIFQKILQLPKPLLQNLIRLDQEMGDLAWSENSWEDLVRDLSSYFLVMGGEQVEILSDQITSFALFRLDSDQAHLLKVVVAKSYQNRHWGEEILKWSFRQLKLAVASVYLEVECSNQNAFKLYQKLNFVTLHQTKSYYGSNRDAFKMLKELK